jgi:hypothetical protein
MILLYARQYCQEYPLPYDPIGVHPKELDKQRTIRHAQLGDR